ncbi:MAG: N-acetylmuramoyl-L-alanine amidase [Chthoniobacterales bacterium]|nr:N-acetylmuramoyl-L-alanine amidase [Chthoniobacterales bacterium]
MKHSKIASFIAILCFVSSLQAAFQAAPKNLMPWASPVDWASLQKYANTITAAGLEKQLQEIYVPDGSWKKWIVITPSAALIEPFPGATQFIKLPLASSQEACQPIPRYWKQKAFPISGKPLAGLNIVIDPGHLGGSWSKMEERWFRFGHSKPVEEGAMTLITAKILAKQLRDLGATVTLTRSYCAPTTSLRPYQLRKAAIAQLQEEGKTSWTRQQLKQREEILFYRTAELHHRAEVINNKSHPDLVICLHYDAQEWDDPKHPKLVNCERVHFLIGGNVNESELREEEDRFMVLRKLLNQSHLQEVGIANAVAHSFKARTKLPPFIYHNPTKARAALASSLYLWNRNLLATRLVEAPVLYCEAYVMNDCHVFNRVQAGDYKGYRSIDQQCCSSLYREYADAVTQGVIDYFVGRK